MNFELAAIIVVAALAVALGLVCYHLLGRLEMLERSVQGGLQPPTARLSREQFERRFRTAHARSSLAAEIETGLLLIVGPEHHPDSELASTIKHLARPNLFSTRSLADIDADSLGVTTTPYLFVVDENMVRTAQPAASSADIVTAMKHFA